MGEEGGGVCVGREGGWCGVVGGRGGGGGVGVGGSGGWEWWGWWGCGVAWCGLLCCVVWLCVCVWLWCCVVVVLCGCGVVWLWCCVVVVLCGCGVVWLWWLLCCGVGCVGCCGVVVVLLCLRPLGSQNEVYKLENFCLCRDRPSRLFAFHFMLFFLFMFVACVSFHLIVSCFFFVELK